MEASDYLARQLNGPIAYSLIQASWEMFSVYEAKLAHWTSLSIDSAVRSELDFIGRILGLPRPILINQTFFRFNTATTPTVDAELGFSSLEDRETGGVLSSTTTIEQTGVKIGDVLYRRYLKACSPLRKYRSIDNLDAMLNSFTEGATYTLSFDSYGDIHIVLSKTVVYAVLDIVQQMADYFFTTSPRIFVTRSTEW